MRLSSSKSLNFSGQTDEKKRILLRQLNRCKTTTEISSALELTQNT